MLSKETIAWLSRVGIVLNFLAGFMLAPELIGLKRLQRLEEKVEALVKRLSENIYKIYLKFSPLGKKERSQHNEERNWKDYILFFVIILPPILFWLSLFSLVGAYIITIFGVLYVHEIVFCILWYFIGILLGLYALCFTVLLYKSSDPSVGIEIGDLFKSFLPFLIYFGFLLAFLFLPLMILFYLLASLFLKIFYTILSSINKKLGGDNTLKSVVVITGIVFFVIGNLFQLLSTF